MGVLTLRLRCSNQNAVFSKCDHCRISKLWRKPTSLINIAGYLTLRKTNLNQSGPSFLFHSTYLCRFPTWRKYQSIRKISGKNNQVYYPTHSGCRRWPKFWIQPEREDKSCARVGMFCLSQETQGRSGRHRIGLIFGLLGTDLRSVYLWN